MSTKCQPFPQARLHELIVKDCDGEVLVYDRERDKAHCLNPIAGAIWRHCDGQTSPGEIAAALKAEHGSHVDENVVWLGVAELRRSNLLISSTTEWPQLTGMSRREAIRRIGLGAAIALPIVASMTAPTAVEAAASCGAKCAPCLSSTQCCGSCFATVPGCTGGPVCGPPGS